MSVRDGARGWDEYAPFYDWENAQTVARRDVAFWCRLAAAQPGPILELGCGTGRIALPIARSGTRLVGIDRSEPMLERARRRLRRARLADCVHLVRGDIRALPFRRRTGFGCVMAPYGVLQSLTRERDLQDTLASVARVVGRGGLFALDLVPDLPRWAEYSRRTSLRGRHARGDSDAGRVGPPGSAAGADDLPSGVRRAARSPRRVHRFELTFRTLSVPQMSRRLESAGFSIDAVLGDYQGGPWDERADTWVILARKK